jgi:6-phosphogluconate dehydrogenase (decarboxylating)
MTVRHRWQETHLDRLSVTRTYMVENKKDKTVAEQVVVMEYTAPGTETFTSSSEEGSGRGEDDFADKMLSALRYQFGGHKEKGAAKKGTA